MENNEQQLDISGLFPDLSTFPSIATDADLSAIFVVALILMFISFLVIGLIPSWYRACGRIKWLNDLLQKETKATVFYKRNDFLESADKHGGTCD